MKRFAAFLLLFFVGVGCVLPTYAQPSRNRYQSRSAQKANKKQQKAMKKYMKAQRKAQRKMVKRDRKNSTYPPRRR